MRRKIEVSILSTAFFAMAIMSLNVAVAARPIRGTYEFPLANRELAKYAVFDVKFHQDDYNGTPEKIVLPFPREVGGDELFVTISKIAGSSQWQGDKVSADCGIEGRDFVCRMTFQDLPVNGTAAESFIKANYADTALAESILKVSAAVRESSEIKGILRYRLRGRDRR